MGKEEKGFCNLSYLLYDSGSQNVPLGCKKHEKFVVNVYIANRSASECPLRKSIIYQILHMHSGILGPNGWVFPEHTENVFVLIGYMLREHESICSQAPKEGCNPNPVLTI